MKRATLAVAAMAFLVCSAGALAQPSDSIPFVNHGTIWNWKAENNRVLDVQTGPKTWYRVTLAAECIGMTNALRIGLDSGPTDTLDNYSNIIVDGQRCPVSSVTKLPSPPKQENGKAQQ